MRDPLACRAYCLAWKLLVPQSSIHSDSWTSAQADSVLRLRLFFPMFPEARDCPHASGALVTFLLSQAPSPRSPPFSALRQPHPWQPRQEIQPSSSFFSQKLERFCAEFLMLSSLPKPKSPDLPRANKCRERLFGRVQKWPWTFAQHSDDRFSPCPPHPNTHASCRIRKCFILFYFIFLFTFSTTLLHEHSPLILSLLPLFWKINQRTTIPGQEGALGGHTVQTFACRQQPCLPR